MSDLDLGDIQALNDLHAALARFGSGASEGLRLAQTEINRLEEWLRERTEHWQRETERARREVDQATATLRRCEASGYRDDDGYYHQPDCSAQARALARVEAHLRECAENLRGAQAWRSRVVQAIGEYQHEAHRLRELAVSDTERAKAALAQMVTKYEQVKAAQAMGGLVTSVIGSISPLSASNSQAKQLGITWAEKQALLQQWLDEGLSPEQFERMKLPISDLREETLQEDRAWVQQVIESERFRKATEGLWTGEVPHVEKVLDLVGPIFGVLADTDRVLRYWKTKE